MPHKAQAVTIRALRSDAKNVTLDMLCSAAETQPKFLDDFTALLKESLGWTILSIELSEAREDYKSKVQIRITHQQ